MWAAGFVLDERWTKIMGRRVWRDINTGETKVEVEDGATDVLHQGSDESRASLADR